MVYVVKGPVIQFGRLRRSPSHEAENVEILDITIL